MRAAVKKVQQGPQLACRLQTLRAWPESGQSLAAEGPAPHTWTPGSGSRLQDNECLMSEATWFVLLHPCRVTQACAHGVY